MKNNKILAIFAVIALLGLVQIFMNGSSSGGTAGGGGVFESTQEEYANGLKNWSYSQLLHESGEKSIRAVVIQGTTLKGQTSSGTAFIVQLPADAKISDVLASNGADVRIQPKAPPSIVQSILLGWGPMILLLGVWFFFMRKMQTGMGRASGFGKSRALLHDGTDKKKVTFKDVAGIEEAKYELVEIVDFLKNPRKFEALGGKIPKGVLLVGPPGTGKTLVARAMAGEANVPFFSCSGSDFVEMFVGVGASRVRDMFQTAKKQAPCIIFIDEIDAMGRHRGAGIGGGNDEREQTLNQMLVEMDGFGANEGIIIVAATNRPDVLDPALLRPGRFDRQVVIPAPDLKGREAILAVHSERLKLAPDFNIETIARGIPGFTGAEIQNLCNEAALTAARTNSKNVTMEHFEQAKDRLLMGNERRSLIMTDQEKELTAYHEAGHALCALLDKHSDPIHKATIIPRGRALGVVMRLPEGDRVSLPLIKIKADLFVGAGGRVAEELIFGEEMVTTGAQSDIQMMTRLARTMVSDWGFSPKLGTIAYGEGQQEVFLGHSLSQGKGVSPSAARIIEQETKRFVDEAYQRARRDIAEHINTLHTIAQALLRYETLTGKQLQFLFQGGSIDNVEGITVDNTIKKNEKEKPKVIYPDAGDEIPAIA